MKKIILVFLALTFTTIAVFAREIWYCPMHPTYIADRAGQCPICGMNLVKKEEKAQVVHQEGSFQKVNGYAPVMISESMQKLIGIKTFTVSKNKGKINLIPRDSVMMDGPRAIVFVVGPDNHFYPQEIKTGLNSNGFIELKDGLTEGQQIVSSANFLVDSQSRLQAAMKEGNHE